MVGTATNVNDVELSGALLHNDRAAAFGEAGDSGIDERKVAQRPHCHMAMLRGRRQQLCLTRTCLQLSEQVEQPKAGISAKVEHRIQVINHLSCRRAVPYRTLANNAARLFSLVGRADLVIAKSPLSTLHARGAP
jgi:IS5 family transposase